MGRKLRLTNQQLAAVQYLDELGVVLVLQGSLATERRLSFFVRERIGCWGNETYEA